MSSRRSGTGQGKAGKAAPPSDEVTGHEVAILDSLIPSLYAKATGIPTKPGDKVPTTDPASVDRLLKVLELRLKYRQMGKQAAPKPGSPPLPWAPAQNGKP